MAIQHVQRSQILGVFAGLEVLNPRVALFRERRIFRERLIEGRLATLHALHGLEVNSAFFESIREARYRAVIAGRAVVLLKFVLLTHYIGMLVCFSRTRCSLICP